MIAVQRHKRLMQHAGGAARAADIVELMVAIPQDTLVEPHSEFGEEYKYPASLQMDIATVSLFARK